MKATNVSGQPPGGQRIMLADQLPLATPILIQFFPIYACNFKCNYCTFSADKKKRDFISDEIRMDFDLFKKCIDEITQFPSQPKVIRFVGMGEPLLHKRIADMVAYAKEKNAAERVEILTNASLLTKKMSDDLLRAGLTRLIISLQGTSSRKYKDVCGVGIEFDEFLDNLAYHYRNKGKSQVHIKIIDLALEDEIDKKKFYDLFGDVCDTIGIEIAGPIFPNVDYEKVLPSDRKILTQYGREKQDATVCPQPFFTMQINPDGNIVPCYSVTYPEILGNARNQHLVDVWNGESYSNFRLKMLDGINNASNTCRQCNIVRHRFQPEDRLDHAVARLKPLFTPLAK
jgi:radical SAM protein with 4Fe4S-binding SPASM domain